MMTANVFLNCYLGDTQTSVKIFYIDRRKTLNTVFIQHFLAWALFGFWLALKEIT